MAFQLFDSVVLEEDLPASGLQAGDIGAIVELYGEEGVEVEFVTGSGATQALVSLKSSQVRGIGANEILAVRSVNAA